MRDCEVRNDGMRSEYSFIRKDYLSCSDHILDIFNFSICPDHVVRGIPVFQFTL